MSTNDIRERIERFLASESFAVAGASEDPQKFGHQCFVCYLRHGKKVVPINPNAATILGQTAYPSLTAVPEPVEAVSIVTPPSVTEKVIEDAVAAGVKHVWMQPGAESAVAIRRAEEAGLNVISGGPCLLVELGDWG